MKLNILLFLLLVMAACRKATDYPLRGSVGLTDSAGSLVQALDKSECHLFDQAFHRAGLDSTLASNGGYTIFAPTDSAMSAAGLTAQAIAGLTPDSLSKLVRYHIAASAYSDGALTSALASIQTPSLLQQITSDSVHGDLVTQQYLYLAENAIVYIDGEPAGNGTPAVKTTNGYLYTINKWLSPPSRTLWDIITTNPDLSLFTAALRIDDSIFINYEINNATYTVPPFYSDSILLSTVNYINNAARTPNLNLPTVFAPTDSAFRAAGFNTVDDIRAYATSQPISFAGTSPDGTTWYDNDIPMDSILYAHIIYSGIISTQGYDYDNPNSTGTGYLVLYNDLLFSPLMNKGLPNADTYQMLWWATNLMYFQPHPLKFSVSNALPYIQWNTALPAAVVLPDNPANRRHFLANNGALYFVDNLFTSPN